MSAVIPLAQVDRGLVEACGAEEEATALCRAVYRVTGNEVAADAADAILGRGLKIVVILGIAFVVTRLLRRVISRFVGGLSPATSARGAQRAQTIGALLRSIATFVVWTVAAVTVLGELGIELGPIIAGAGIVGIALGFGAQNLVRDFLSGIFMLIEDQYGVGDVIDVGPATGTVEAVSLRTTRLRDIYGNVWHVPNGTIDWVANKSQQWSRALLDISVAYATDVERASEIIKTVADQLWRDEVWNEMVLEEPAVWGVERLGADGIDIRLVVKTTPSSQWKVARELRARIKCAFDEAGIEIPFPQRTIWHRTEDGQAVPPVTLP